MKLVYSIVLIGLVVLIASEIQAQAITSENRPVDTLYNARSKTVLVPYTEGKLIVIDGMFSAGEWDDALNFSITENYTIYFKADADILYIGLKSAEPIGELVCEIRMTSDEKAYFLLHVSGALGEGISDFPANSRFELNNNTFWEANFLKADSLKNAAWIAEGRPIEKYDDVYNKRDGIEFKLYRNKFGDNNLKFTIGWVRVEVEGQKIDKRTFNYPLEVRLNNVDSWAELILPVSEKEVKKVTAD